MNCGGCRVSDFINALEKLELPKQTSAKLTFCGNKPKQLLAWLKDTSGSDTKQTSILFYKLLPEINHLSISGSHRLSLLTILRPHIHRCISILADDFLSHPLSLTENMTKIAAIAQALQRHLSDGFLLSAYQLAKTKKPSANTREELSLALYYSSHGIGQSLFRSCQLYTPRAPSLWRKLHLTFQIAKQFEFENKTIHDELLYSNKYLTIKRCYLQSLLLASSQINQLRQLDIFYLYKTFESWSSICDLQQQDNAKHNLYWIDMNSDDGPAYQSRLINSSSSSLYGLDFKNILELINNHRDNNSDNTITEIPIHLRQSLIAHLSSAWNQEHSRLSPRQPSKIEIDACIGLKQAHQQLLGEMSFNDFLNLNSHQSDSKLGLNGLSSTNTAHNDPSSVSSAINQICKVSATDISKEGYCLSWPGAAPEQIKAGEIILLKHPETGVWQVGTIRWTQRLNSFMYAGVKLLSESAQASAASTTLDDGSETPFFRALLLKNENGENSTSSLITPSIPFTTQQSIQLQIDKSCSKAQLNQLLLSSGTVSQFTFRPL